MQQVDSYTYHCLHTEEQCPGKLRLKCKHSFPLSALLSALECAVYLGSFQILDGSKGIGYAI